MATEVISTIRSSGGDYTTLTAWEAAEQADLVAADEIAVAECYDDWTGDGLSDELIIDGWTVDATRYVHVRAASGHEHGGQFGAGFRMYKSSGICIKIITDYTRITGIEIINPATGSQNGYTQACMRVHGNDCVVSRCLATGNGSGFLFATGGGVIDNYFINCISRSKTSGYGYGFYSYYGYATYVYNCLASDHANGYWLRTQTTLKNAVAYGNTTNYANQTPTTATNNAASDASTNTPPGTNPITTDIVSGDFTDAANDDYSLASGSTLIDAGADLSSDFTDDVIGTTRGATWDVGAFEYVSGGSTDTLLADDVESASETTGPAVGQEHGLTASDTQSTSETSSPAVGQEHGLLADDCESTSETSAPALQEVVPLSANDTESASETTSPAVGQVHTLGAASVESASESGVTVVGQIHVLAANDTQSTSELTSPAITEVNNVHVLYADDTQSTSEVTLPGFGQIHAMAANDIQSVSQVTGPGLGIVGLQQHGNFLLMRRRGRR